jgi:hypothetical protein
MTVQTFLILTLIQMYIPILVVVLAFLRFSERPLYIKFAGYESLGSLLASVPITIFTHLIHIKGVNNFIANSYIPIDIFLWMGIYHSVMQSKKYTRALIIAGIPILLFWLINFLFIQKMQVNSYSLVLMAALMLVLSIHYFYSIIQSPPTDRLLSFPFFWINSGVLLYSATTLVLFLFTDYLINVLKDNLLYYWTFHTVMRIVLVLFISLGVWKELQNHK